MKVFLILLIALPFYAGVSACGQSTAGEQQAAAEDRAENKVEVYYFHFERRCVSCINVQKATEKVLKENYGQELREGTIVYHEVNLSNTESREIAQKLDVGRQGLLVVNGNEKEDLTMQGFMFASRDYDRFKETMVEAIVKLSN